jgi:hypothetical protein
LAGFVISIRSLFQLPLYPSRIYSLVSLKPNTFLILSSIPLCD